MDGGVVSFVKFTDTVVVTDETSVCEAVAVTAPSASE